MPVHPDGSWQCGCFVVGHDGHPGGEHCDPETNPFPVPNVLNPDGTVRWGEWDGNLCPLEGGDPDGVCIHHEDDGIPCEFMLFCMTRDGEFEVPDGEFEVPPLEA